MKKVESIFFLMPVKIRLKLERTAVEYGVTMSWIIRAIILWYRTENCVMPVFKRPAKLLGRHCRFSLKLYGDKCELLTFCKCNGGEFSPFIRYLLDLWFEGKIIPDLQSVLTVKTIKKIEFQFNRVASISPTKIYYYKKSEFWKKNPQGNLFLMYL